MADNTRWYDRNTLEILEEVAKADGKGTTKTTLRHAKKLGLLPSNTSIISSERGASHQLVDWKIDQVMNACIAFPFSGDASVKDETDRYTSMIHAKANEYADKARDEGKILHRDIARWIDGHEPENPISVKITDQLKRHLEEMNVIEMIPEKTIGSAEIGYAGTPDLYCKTKTGALVGVLIIDFKSVNFKNYKEPYPEQKIQLGGYANMGGWEGRLQLENIAMDRATGDLLYFLHEDSEEWAKAFQRLFENWCLIKGYDPRNWS